MLSIFNFISLNEITTILKLKIKNPNFFSLCSLDYLGTQLVFRVRYLNFQVYNITM